jgi:periplasmic divalent cation tolerance protein
VTLRPSWAGGDGASAFVQIQFTIDDAAVADVIVEDLLHRHLIACGQRLGPMVSRYWWKGAVARAEEWMVMVKTRSDLAAEVIEAIADQHPYETPEVVSFPFGQGAPDYLAWIHDSTVGILR